MSIAKSSQHWVDSQRRRPTWVDCQCGLSALKAAADVRCHTAILSGIFWSYVVDLKDAVGQNCYSERQRRAFSFNQKRVRRLKEHVLLPGYLSVCRGNVLWFNSQVMVEGGLETTVHENLATEPSVTVVGTG